MVRKKGSDNSMFELSKKEYRIYRGHGVVQEVVFLLLWSHSVAKANVAILLIAAVTSSTKNEKRITEIFFLNTGGLLGIVMNFHSRRRSPLVRIDIITQPVFKSFITRFCWILSRSSYRAKNKKQNRIVYIVILLFDLLTRPEYF